NTRPGMPVVHQVIILSLLFDVAIIVVRPLRRPRVHKLKNISAIFKSPVVPPRYMKMVLSSETDSEVFLRDPANVPVLSPFSSLVLVAVGLRLLPFLISPDLVIFSLLLVPFLVLPRLVFVRLSLRPLFHLPFFRPGFRFLFCWWLFLFLFFLLFRLRFVRFRFLRT